MYTHIALHLAVQVQVQRVFNYNFPLEEDHYECAYILTRHGIDIEMLNREGDSALDIVNEDFAELLERKFISNMNGVRSVVILFTLMALTSVQLFMKTESFCQPTKR